MKAWGRWGAPGLACPSFAAWLQVAAFTGLRPGELDALRWTRIDFDRDRIIVAGQFSAATRRFDTPKNHQRREVPLTMHARSALQSLARESEFCFVSLRGGGHRDKHRALDRIVNAYADAATGAARGNRPRRSGSSTSTPSQRGLFGDIYV